MKTENWDFSSSNDGLWGEKGNMTADMPRGYFSTSRATPDILQWIQLELCDGWEWQEMWLDEHLGEVLAWSG